jgi:anthranilate phosphoribosyltransferase
VTIVADQAGPDEAADMAFPQLTGRLVRGEHLTAADAEAAMTAMMSGDASPVQIAGFLVALRAKGETGAELTGLVRTMRRFARRVTVDFPTVDTCGTGGDGAGTFNISTVSAVVAAGAGAKVAKHGNRAASGRCGSADLLEAWGVAITLPPEHVARCLDEVGIGFCFAPAYHPAMRHVMPTRRELKVPTAFNFLGPLTNPVGAGHQALGVADPVMAERMAMVLAETGARHALVFHGDGGLDELTTTGPSRVWEVRDGSVEHYVLDPADLGLPPAGRDDLRGGDVHANRAIADAVLDGKPGAPRDVVLLGAGAALYAADAVDDVAAGVRRAAEAIDSGAARRTLDRWVTRSNELAAG